MTALHLTLAFLCGCGVAAVLLLRGHLRRMEEMRRAGRGGRAGERGRPL
jgi:hypothetical protein